MYVCSFVSSIFARYGPSCHRDGNRWACTASLLLYGPWCDHSPMCSHVGTEIRVLPTSEFWLQHWLRRAILLCVYVVTSAACATGSYGPNCTRPCNCSTDQRCDRDTGRCHCPAGKAGHRCTQGSTTLVHERFIDSITSLRSCALPHWEYTVLASTTCQLTNGCAVYCPQFTIFCV